MIRSIFFTLLFFVSLAVTFTTFVVSIALGKEGIGIEDVGKYLSISAIYLGVILIWYLFSRWMKSDYIKSISYVSILINCLPLLLTFFLLGSLIYNDLLGKRQSKNAVISNYHESYINWSGFSYPVGLHMEISMPTPFAVNYKRYAGFYSPVIWMGPYVPAAIRKQIFFNTFGWALEISDNSPTYIMLRSVLFNKIKPQAHIIAQQGDSKMIFDLYPSAIEYLENSNGFCTFSGITAKDIYANEAPPDNYATGGQLNAMWFYVGKTYVDLSDQLTLVLQQSSQLENNPRLWVEMQRQFDDSNLLRIGYHQCVLSTRTHCFCK